MDRNNNRKLQPPKDIMPTPLAMGSSFTFGFFTGFFRPELPNSLQCLQIVQLAYVIVHNIRSSRNVSLNVLSGALGVITGSTFNSWIGKGAAEVVSENSTPFKLRN